MKAKTKSTPNAKSAKPANHPATAVMTAPESGVRVRMYRQGLGDCFLLAFPGEAGEPFYMLIDCGVIVGQVSRTPDIRAVAQHIADSTRNRLDVIVATHQHWDHVSGFVDAKDIFQRIRVGQVWFAWTENLKDDVSRRLLEKKQKAQSALRKASAHMNRNARSVAGDAFGIALDSVIGFLGADAGNRTTEAALDNLRAFTATDPRYCDPADDPIGLPGVPGVRIYVLGPPRDEQKIKRYNDRASDPQTYHIGELTLATQTEFLAAALDTSPEVEGGVPKFPFDSRHQVGKHTDARRYSQLEKLYFGGPNAWREISLDWLRGVSALALNLDNATNNTSLALAIELEPNGKVLLFPADAQVGNWLSWHDQSWKDANHRQVTAEDLLSRTVLYKAGHHCSHNATLRQRGLQLMTSEELIAMIPLDRATAEKKRWPMPWPKLRTNLLTATQGRTLQVDDTDFPAKRPCPPGTKASAWRKFQESVTGDQNFFEITIS